eukprot:scaffold301_cov393-Prasinococcus_capsulatus_cf.AAC.2
MAAAPCYKVWHVPECGRDKVKGWRVRQAATVTCHTTGFGDGSPARFQAVAAPLQQAWQGTEGATEVRAVLRHDDESIPSDVRATARHTSDPSEDAATRGKEYHGQPCPVILEKASRQESHYAGDPNKAPSGFERDANVVNLESGRVRLACCEERTSHSEEMEGLRSAATPPRPERPAKDIPVCVPDTRGERAHETTPSGISNKVSKFEYFMEETPFDSAGTGGLPVSAPGVEANIASTFVLDNDTKGIREASVPEQRTSEPTDAVPSLGQGAHESKAVAPATVSKAPSLFTTAGGQQVLISPEVLERAKQLAFEDDDPHDQRARDESCGVDKSSGTRHSLFQTAGGKSVHLSEHSLAKAAKLFDEEAAEPCPQEMPLCANSRPSDRGVKRSLPEAFDGRESGSRTPAYLGPANRNPERVNVGKFRKQATTPISEVPLRVNTLDTMPGSRFGWSGNGDGDPGNLFQMANGKNIELTRESIERARRLLRDEDHDVVDGAGKAKASTPSPQRVGDSSTHSRNSPAGETVRTIPDSTRVSGARLANASSGQAPLNKNSSLPRLHKAMGHRSVLRTPAPSKVGFKTPRSCQSHANGRPPSNFESKPVGSLFRSARGSNLSISATAMARAQRFFAEELEPLSNPGKGTTWLGKAGHCDPSAPESLTQAKYTPQEEVPPDSLKEKPSETRAVGKPSRMPLDETRRDLSQTFATHEHEKAIVDMSLRTDKQHVCDSLVLEATRNPQGELHSLYQGVSRLPMFMFFAGEPGSDRNDWMVEPETASLSSESAASYLVKSSNPAVHLGFKDFHDILMRIGVNPKLCTVEWVKNHFRWIVWKLASYERQYPSLGAKTWLVARQVLNQLLYRSQRELHGSSRSILRRILEHDIAPSVTMTLVVARILDTVGLPMSEQDNREHKIALELSDGWYGVVAEVDDHMRHIIKMNKIRVGDKLKVACAKLAPAAQAGPRSPAELEDSQVPMISVHSNGTRKTKWDERLGLQKGGKTIFAVPLSDVNVTGGVVPLTRFVVVKAYPMVTLEHTESGNVFRSSRAEAFAENDYNRKRQAIQERISDQAQNDYSESDGLTLEERELFLQKLRLAHESRMKEALTEANLPEQRRITRCLKMRVRGLQLPKDVDVHPYREAIITVWGPSDVLLEEVKPGVAFSATSLSPYESKSFDMLQLTAQRVSRFEKLGVGVVPDSWMADICREPCTVRLEDLEQLYVGQEFDVAGLVIKIGDVIDCGKTKRQWLWLCDGTGQNINMPDLLAVQLSSPSDSFVPFQYELPHVQAPGAVGVACRTLKLSRYDHMNRVWTACFTEGSELFTKPRGYLGEAMDRVSSWSRSPGVGAEILHLGERVSRMIQVYVLYRPLCHPNRHNPIIVLMPNLANGVASTIHDQLPLVQQPSPVPLQLAQPRSSLGTAFHSHDILVP